MTAAESGTAVFERERTRLRAVAYRLLGSVPEADDAVQEAWLRLQRTDVTEIDNLPAWLTTVVSRICLDLLRSRTARREDLGGLDDAAAVSASVVVAAGDPAAEAERADEVGHALMVVLETLAPAERLAFCLHDLFGLPFDEVADVLRRSPAACRQLASRARRRVRGQSGAVEVDRARQREIVAAFLDAARHGNFTRLLELLHPGVVLSADPTAAALGAPARIAGAPGVVEWLSGKAAAARLTELDGFAAAKWTHRGELLVVFGFTVEDGRIVQIELLGEGLADLDVAPDRTRDDPRPDR